MKSSETSGARRRLNVELAKLLGQSGSFVANNNNEQHQQHKSNCLHGLLGIQKLVLLKFL